MKADLLKNMAIFHYEDPKMKIRITETVLRDAHQSLFATRMKTEDMLPICTLMDRVGYWSIEVWGGATFDACLRFLKEDPWERISALKTLMPKTPFQMLLRGQNLVGYRHYSDDIVERFVEKAYMRGIDVFRIFDALNDTRNLRTSMRAAKRVGAKVEACMSYTTSPVHDNKLYINTARRLTEMGADSLCIKDMAGLLSPFTAYDLVTGLKEVTDIPIHMHCHTTSGMGASTYLKAIEAGAEIIDTAISSMSMGTSQPPTESAVVMLKGTKYDTGLDIRKLAKISEYFKEVRKRYKGFESEFTGIDTNILVMQIPGGMMSNLAAQLKEAGQEDKMALVLEEVPKVKADLGHIPLVTPTSQIVASQAVLNIIAGERYKMVSNETRNLVKGLYGKTPGEINPGVMQKILGNERPITVRPADLLEPELEKMKADLGSKAKGDEDVLTYALFPQVAREFFKDRDEGKTLDLQGLADAVLAKEERGMAPAIAEPAKDMGVGRIVAAAVSAYLLMRDRVAYRPIERKIQRNVWSVAAKYERISLSMTKVGSNYDFGR